MIKFNKDVTLGLTALFLAACLFILGFTFNWLMGFCFQHFNITNYTQYENQYLTTNSHEVWIGSQSINVSPLDHLPGQKNSQQLFAQCFGYGLPSQYAPTILAFIPYLSLIFAVVGIALIANDMRKKHDGGKPPAAVAAAAPADPGQPGVPAQPVGLHN